jgi:phosphoribosylglycinamide formyltransferase-1
VTNTPLKVAVLISGRGSNLKTLIEACASPSYPAQIVLVISNNAEAGGLVFAKQAGIPTTIVEHKNFASREAFDAAVQMLLDRSGVELICLAGFMRILSDGFVRHWRGRMINIHPSLLPAFKGTHVHEQAIAAGVRISGCTVHYVSSELDSGPAIAQAAVPVHPGDTAETLAARVLEAEHCLYPQALRLIAEGRVRLSGERVLFADVQNAQGVLCNPISR